MKGSGIGWNVVLFCIPSKYEKMKLKWGWKDGTLRRTYYKAKENNGRYESTYGRTSRCLEGDKGSQILHSKTGALSLNCIHISIQHAEWAPPFPANQTARRTGSPIPTP